MSSKAKGTNYLVPIFGGTVLGTIFGAIAANVIAAVSGWSAGEVGIYVLPLATSICTALVFPGDQPR